MSAPIISLVNDQPRTLSTDVAAFFGKKHLHVLREIRNIIANCPESFHESNFGLMSVTVQIGNGATRQDPAYSMTRDGFVLLAMGFTGKKALEWKIKYIEAFNQMEAELSVRSRNAFKLTSEDAPRALDTPTKVKDRKPLNALINTWVSLAPLSYRDAWQQVKTAFGVERAEALTVSQIKPACDWVQSRIDAVLAAAVALPAPSTGKVPSEIIDVIMKASHQNLSYQKAINRLYVDVCRTLNELDSQLFEDWKKLDDCFMSLVA